LPLIESDLLRNAVQQRLWALRPFLEHYRRELTDPAWQQFIQATSILVDLVESFHRDSVDRATRTHTSDPASKERDIGLYSSVALEVLGNIHHQLLPFLHKGRLESEYLLLPTIQRKVGEHDPSAQVVLLPDFEFNYGYLGLKDYVLGKIKKLQPYLNPTTAGDFIGRAAGLCRWNVFLVYPVTESQSALNLCVVAHELAHFFDQHEELYKQCLPQKLDETSFKALIEKLCSMTVTGQGQMTMESLFTRATIESKAYQECIEIVENWLREVIADILAARVLGPAYFFALVEYFAHVAAENASSSTHPAMAIRLNLVMEELGCAGYLEPEGPTKIREVLLVVKQRIDDEVKKTVHSDHAHVAYETTKGQLSLVQTKLRALTTAIAYDASKYTEEVPPAIALLLKGIAPIEKLTAAGDYRPNGVVSIVNAGWEVYKTRNPEFRALFADRVSEFQALSNLNQLLLKAVEASEVVQRWPQG